MVDLGVIMFALIVIADKLVERTVIFLLQIAGHAALTNPSYYIMRAADIYFTSTMCTHFNDSCNLYCTYFFSQTKALLVLLLPFFYPRVTKQYAA